MLRTDQPVFIFDGHCVLCSSGVAFIMKHDKRGAVRFLSGQSDLGRRIYALLGKPIDESYIFVDGAGVHMKTDGWFRVMETLGGAWRLPTVFKVIPRPIRDWAYDILARNRYRWFGKSEYCAVLTPEQRSRLVEDDHELRRQLG